MNEYFFAVWQEIVRRFFYVINILIILSLFVYLIMHKTFALLLVLKFRRTERVTVRVQKVLPFDRFNFSRGLKLALLGGNLVTCPNSKIYL